jgi:hypothetical protein
LSTWVALLPLVFGYLLYFQGITFVGYIIRLDIFFNEEEYSNKEAAYSCRFVPRRITFKEAAYSCQLVLRLGFNLKESVTVIKLEYCFFLFVAGACISSNPA